MTEEKAHIVFNISGGNNQILPNATEAVQNFNYYGEAGMESHRVSEEGEEVPMQDSTTPNLSSRFAIYINKVEVRNRYIDLLKQCQSAAEVGRLVVAMVQEVPGLTIQTAKTEPFITILLALATSVHSGTTVANFRKSIDNAWYSKKE